MFSDLLLGATILIGVVGVVLLIDLARVGMLGSRSLSDPDRQQLAVGLATVAFAALFFLGRAVGAPDPVPADLEPAPAQRADGASLARLAVAARLPSLQPPPRPREPAAEKPPRATAAPEQPPPAAEDVPASPPPEPVEPAAEPAPVAPAPAPAPEPAPAPQPEPPPPVPFNSSG